jgi:hypothetical protein
LSPGHPLGCHFGSSLLLFRGSASAERRVSEVMIRLARTDPRRSRQRWSLTNSQQQVGVSSLEDAIGAWPRACRWLAQLKPSRPACRDACRWMPSLAIIEFEAFDHSSVTPSMPLRKRGRSGIFLVLFSRQVASTKTSCIFCCFQHKLRPSQVLYHMRPT